MKLLCCLFLSCYLSVRRRREHEDATSRREATLQPDRQQQGSQVYTNVCTILNLLESFGARDAGLENCPNKMSRTFQDLVEECRKSDVRPSPGGTNIYVSMQGEKERKSAKLQPDSYSSIKETRPQRRKTTRNNRAEEKSKNSTLSFWV